MVGDIEQMHGTDAQMSLDRCMEQTPDALSESTADGICTKRSKSWIRQISSWIRVNTRKRLVVLVVQMVRALAQTSRGVDLSHTQCYTFPCIDCF